MRHEATTALGYDADVNKSESFLLRLSEEELEMWRAAAQRDDMPLSQWIRRRCNGQAGAKAPEPATKPRKRGR